MCLCNKYDNKSNKYFFIYSDIRNNFTTFKMQKWFSRYH